MISSDCASFIHLQLQPIIDHCEKIVFTGYCITYKNSWSLFKWNSWNLLCSIIFISSQTKRSLAIELSVNEIRSDKPKLSLDNSRIPKLRDSSRKLIPKKQRKAMSDPFVEKITRTRTNKKKKVSCGMVETRSQKTSKGNVRSRGLSGLCHRLESRRTWTGRVWNLARESTPVVKFCQTLKKKSELYISTENVANKIEHLSGVRRNRQRPPRFQKE